VKVGDKAIVVKCINDKYYRYKCGVIVKVDIDAFNTKYVYPYLIRLEGGCEIWCRAIPCSSLIEELL